jgi:hypothetical protein
LRPAGKPLKSSTKAVLLSMAIPGGGQYYTKNYIRSLAFFAAEASFAFGISWQNDRMLAARKSAENWAKDPADHQFHHEEIYSRGIEASYRNQRNKLIWWLAGTIFLSMGDAYVDAHMYGLDVSPNLDNNTGAVGVAVSRKF